MDWRSLIDPGAYWRYGMSGSEKEALALSGKVPGQPKANSELADEAQRYTAGYLFAKKHPGLQRVADFGHYLLSNDKPELQSWATAGANRGAQDLEEEARAAERQHAIEGAMSKLAGYQ